MVEQDDSDTWPHMTLAAKGAMGRQMTLKYQACYETGAPAGWPGPGIVNEGFTGETGQAALDAGIADAVGFGKDYISNPDLAERLKAGAPLNPWNMATFYTPGPEGYVDYPALEAAEA